MPPKTMIAFQKFSRGCLGLSALGLVGCVTQGSADWPWSAPSTLPTAVCQFSNGECTPQEAMAAYVAASNYCHQVANLYENGGNQSSQIQVTAGWVGAIAGAVVAPVAKGTASKAWSGLSGVTNGLQTQLNDAFAASLFIQRQAAVVKAASAAEAVIFSKTNPTDRAYFAVSMVRQCSGAASGVDAAILQSINGGQQQTSPGTPTGVSAVAANGQATVSFAAPANNGGAAITGYTVTSLPAGGVDSNAGTTKLNHLVTGLTNGTAYTFSVTATNSAGTSIASPPSNSVTPIGSMDAPGAPSDVVALGGDSRATVTFKAPAGGSAVTGYEVVSDPLGGIDSDKGKTGLSHVITGLTNGTAYKFTVTAKSEKGNSNASVASNSVTPATMPSSPTGVSAVPGNGQATVTFSAPTNTGGSPVTGYTVVSAPAGGTDSDAGSQKLIHTIKGLNNGTTYTFTVTATNSAGTSLPSVSSSGVIPSNLQ